MLTKSDKKWITDQIGSAMFQQSQKMLEMFEKFQYEFKNDLLTFKDQIVGRIQQSDEEIAALGYRQMRHSEQIAQLQEKVGLPVTAN